MNRPYNHDEVKRLMAIVKPLRENRSLAWDGMFAVMYQLEEIPFEDWRARQPLWDERKLYDAEITRLNRQIGGYQGRINSMLGVTKRDLKQHKFNREYEEKYGKLEGLR